MLWAMIPPSRLSIGPGYFQLSGKQCRWTTMRPNASFPAFLTLSQSAALPPHPRSIIFKSMPHVSHSALFRHWWCVIARPALVLGRVTLPSMVVVV